MPQSDRNAEARRQTELALGRGRFQQLFDTGKVAVTDRFGNPVKVQDYVLYHAPHDLVFEVVDVRPSPDPHAPPGYVRITLTAMIPITYHVQQRALDLAVIGRKIEEGHSEITGPQFSAQPPAATDGGEPSQAPPMIGGSNVVPPLPDEDPDRE